jgi:uncharacterized membrane protein YfcA
MNWLMFALAGSVAQLVDGAMGMGFGLTSATLLLTLGATAALSSTAVHIAEIGTTLASGVSHWKVGNVDKKVLKQLAIPGGIGAFSGATFLSFIDLSVAKIFISTLLLFLGGLLLYRSIFKVPEQVAFAEMKSPRFMTYLGLTGGFVDASGGGGWGPVVTPTLLASSVIEPRKVIGTVSMSEFIVALSASAGFLINIARLDVNWATVGGLALGGMITAPFAAMLAGRLPKKVLGILVALTIIIINGARIMSA